MSHPRFLVVLTSLSLATAALLGAALDASAQVVIPTNRNGLIQQNELQTLRNQLQRQQFSNSSSFIASRTGRSCRSLALKCRSSSKIASRR
ncbi:hypothetical protein [Mesorhizobium sp.]|uniref:hypothetical protein n=1 Tax=Mesorhizobium sp. TaxID=1871066 RepID=UPI0025E20C84|nr:hypothetical protein [Mesorhizobium sp.]